MTEFPYLPLWTDAYLADTKHLTTIEHGAYLLLLMAAWRSPGCCLPDDDGRLAIITGLTAKKWRAIRPTISAFWIISDGVWKQKRLTKEITFVSRKSEKRRAAAEARWNAKPLKTQEPTHANASFLHMQNACNADAPTPTPILTPKIKINNHIRAVAIATRTCDDDFFDRFWLAYPKRGGANPKQPARKKFVAACKSGVDVELIIAGARRYASEASAANQIGTPYIAMAVTWLNQQRWMDYPASPNGSPVVKLPPGLPSSEELRRKYANAESDRGEGLSPVVPIGPRPRPENGRLVQRSPEFGGAKSVGEIFFGFGMDANNVCDGRSGMDCSSPMAGMVTRSDAGDDCEE